MGRGFDVCLARPEDAATCEERLESEFVACLVRQSGLVIAGVKPAAVFGFRPRASRCQDDMVSRAIDAYARRFAAEGVMMHLLGERGGAQMLVVWRPRLVAKLLESASNRDFLTRRASRNGCRRPHARPRGADNRLLRAPCGVPARSRARSGLPARGRGGVHRRRRSRVDCARALEGVRRPEGRPQAIRAARARRASCEEALLRGGSHAGAASDGGGIERRFRSR